MNVIGGCFGLSVIKTSFAILINEIKLILANFQTQKGRHSLGFISFHYLNATILLILFWRMPLMDVSCSLLKNVVSHFTLWRGSILQFNINKRRKGSFFEVENFISYFFHNFCFSRNPKKTKYHLSFLLIKIEILDFTQLGGNKLIKPFVLIIVGVIVKTQRRLA